MNTNFMSLMEYIIKYREKENNFKYIYPKLGESLVSMSISRVLLLITSFFICIGNAADVTKVLQNGLNGYDGCYDSYLYRSGLDSSTYTQNFGDEEYIITAN